MPDGVVSGWADEDRSCNHMSSICAKSLTYGRGLSNLRRCYGVPLCGVGIGLGIMRRTCGGGRCDGVVFWRRGLWSWVRTVLLRWDGGVG